MTSYIFAIILLLLALGGVVVRKTYYYLPAIELKRRAVDGDVLAGKLYRVVAYGSSLRGLLWLFIVLTSAGGFVLLARTAPAWLSLLAVVFLLWAAFSWLPASRVTRIGRYLTTTVTPPIAWLLNYLHPVLSRSTELAGKRYTKGPHTGLFERVDLLDLLEQQYHQPDNRFSEEELEIARRALSFGDYKVSDIMTPRKHITVVNAKDTIGPVLIDELHKGGQDYVLVRESAKGDFIGSLAYKRLDLERSGQVRDFMEAGVYYLHESDVLSDALHTFFSTSHPLFIVVNSSEEYIGAVTINNILRQLLGHLPGDDFDQHGDLTAVAKRRHQKEEASESVASQEAADKKDDDSESKAGNDEEQSDQETDETPVKTDDKMLE